MDINKELYKIIEGNKGVNYVEEWNFLKHHASEMALVKFGIVCVQKSNSSKMVEEYLNIVNNSSDMGLL